MSDHAIGPYWDCDCFTDGELEDKRRVIRASVYDALAVELAEERRDHDNCRYNRQEILRNLTRVEDELDGSKARISALESQLDDMTAAARLSQATVATQKDKIAALEAALNGVEGKLAEYLERLLQGRA